ncbi:hypothetical protein [Halorussus salinisoli]|uniref:hypothetical protein n=1 Tax=Halorussus salinisoli TaxID=2558242 RepID=UPI00148546A3|nr:hypothetical protein [Halorussus salinisoli]
MTEAVRIDWFGNDIVNVNENGNGSGIWNGNGIGIEVVEELFDDRSPHEWRPPRRPTL